MIEAGFKIDGTNFFHTIWYANHRDPNWLAVLYRSPESWHFGYRFAYADGRKNWYGFHRALETPADQAYRDTAEVIKHLTGLLGPVHEITLNSADVQTVLQALSSDEGFKTTIGDIEESNRWK